MTIEQSAPAEQTSTLVVTAREDASLAELMRQRALAMPVRLIVAQGAAAVALSGAMAVFEPSRWGIAALAGVTVSMHALWSVAVHRTTPTPEARGWALVQRAAGMIGTGTALALLFASSIALLGHLQS